MGIYIGLDIVPNNINQKDWQKVFEETMQLIQAYPFATLKEEDVYGFKRLALDRADGQCVKEYGVEEKYWKINGDLESKETGESFTLFSSLDRYSRLKESSVTEDILLNFLNKNERGAREVFYAKTQGKDYHTYLLSIAALIESRFPKSTCVYGDITRAQAQKAVNWANSILDKPIDLPVRVDPSRLLERLKVIDNEEKRLKALYDLSIGDSEEVDDLIAKHFNVNTIRNYFAKKLRGFESATQLGAELIIIRYLNAGLPLEMLVDICCFEKNGPQFSLTEFTKGICATWVLVEPTIRENINCVNKATDTPETVEEQFGSVFLDMRFMGRRTRRYISKEEVIKVLKGKLGDSNQLEEIIETKYQDIVKMLEDEGRKQKKLIDESHAKTKENIIYTLEQLMFWNDKYEISEFIIKGITTVKEAVDESIATRTNLMQIIKEAEEQDQLIKVLSQLIQDQQSLVLTKSAWDWIENESNDVVKRMMAMLVLPVENASEVRKLYRALFENQGLYYKYMK